MNNEASYQDLSVKVTPLVDDQQLKKQWQELEKKSNVSFFLSWDWIGAWLAIASEELPISLLTVKRKSEVIGLALLVEESVTRRKIVSSRTMTFNGSIHSAFNMMIEHNRILAASGVEPQIYAAVLAYFVKNLPKIDEFVIPFIDKDNDMVKLNDNDSLSLKIIDSWSSPFVDLEVLRKNNISYIDSLSRNTRYQIRKSIKLYSELGELKISEAASVEEAIIYFDSLKKLHQRYWERKGLKGAFSNSIWEKFHKGIIQHQFSNDSIQLLKVSVGRKDLGFIYSLISNGAVNMIQSGFDYDIKEKAKPGYVCHYLAIQYNLDQGMKVYDFLAGDSQYKKSLSNQEAQQLMLVFQKKKLKFFLEEFFLNMFRMLRRIF